MINTSKPLDGTYGIGLVRKGHLANRREVKMMSRSAKLESSEPECRGRPNWPCYRRSSIITTYSSSFFAIATKSNEKSSHPQCNTHHHALSSCIISAAPLWDWRYNKVIEFLLSLFSILTDQKA
jgi:hypothetical protein